MTEDHFCNRRLAQAIRKVSELHEASTIKAVKNPAWEEWANKLVPADSHRSTVEPKYWLVVPGYTKDHHTCIREVVGDDPIATILDCLFTAGYCDMFEFADEVLGKEEDKANG